MPSVISTARRERKAERERNAEAAHLTFRERLGVSLSKLTQTELDAAVKELARQAMAGDSKAIHALARLADQSFGRAKEAEVPDGRDSADKTFEEMTVEERAAYRAELLDRIRQDGTAAGDYSDPRGVEPPATRTYSTATEPTREGQTAAPQTRESFEVRSD